VPGRVEENVAEGVKKLRGVDVVVELHLSHTGRSKDFYGAGLDERLLVEEADGWCNVCALGTFEFWGGKVQIGLPSH